MKLYSIANWKELYENNRTRELKRMYWVPIPAKFDGDGYTELVDRPNGAAIYGCWIACVILAGRCDPRGTLVRQSGEPHTVTSISRISRLPKKEIAETLEIAEAIGWLTFTDVAPSCDNLAPSCTRMEWNGKEGMEKNKNQCGTTQASDSAAEELFVEGLEFLIKGKDEGPWFCPVSFRDELVRLYPGVDIDRHLQLAAVWCRENPTKRKTKTGIKRFLHSWMDRHQNRGTGGKGDSSATASSAYRPIEY